MGSLIDTSVFIDIERSDRSGARPAGAGWHALLSSLGEDEEVGMAAISLGWRVATANVRHFRRVPGLDVVAIGSA